MIVVWHRADLRTHDHPALHEAATRGRGVVVPLFVLDPALLGPPYTGRARVAFLHANLQALEESYRRLGSSLVVRYGRPEEVVPEVAREAGARTVCCLRTYEPVGRARDERVGRALEAAGAELRVLEGDTVHEVGSLRAKSGGPYRVFAHFWRAWSAVPVPQPLPAPGRLEQHGLGGVEVPEPQTHVRLPPRGEAAARERLETFVREVGHDYATSRNLPAVDGTSRLSPYLHLGVLSPRVAALRAAEAGLVAWAREVAWRDFFRHLLWDEPRISTEPYREDWRGFPWREAPEELERWRLGQTGYPIVDAGMRQLLSEGWMQNRMRLIVSTFLNKHLLVSPFAGTEVFNESLIDGDEAINVGNWQWVAGCGVDATPYFRVLNPVTQGEKFDSDGQYIRRHLPELAGLAPPDLHAPWRMLRPPRGYPEPMVDLKAGRDRFLTTARAFLKPDVV